MTSARSLLPLSLFLVLAAHAGCSDDDTSSGTGAKTGSGASGGTGGTGALGGSGGGGAGGGGTGGVHTGSLDCSPASGSVPTLKLTSIATGLHRPLLAKSSVADSSRLYILQQDGVIRLVKDGQLVDKPFLDISSLTVQPSGHGEQGLLGLAFHPDYEKNGRFFVHYSDVASGDTRVMEYRRSSSDPDVADPTAVGKVLEAVQPESNHNGGSIEFSPTDGMLYIFLGDGGGAGDDHGPTGNGQNLGVLLGKVLRLDVTSLPPKNPPGNMSGAGVEGAIWDYGVRNPFRSTFDGCTGDLYIGDVGQYDWEEVNIEPTGQGNKNYGWRITEGNECYPIGTTGCSKTGITPPVVTYDHGAAGNCVIGGYVYRGSAIPGLRGQYLYSDNGSGTLWRLTWKDGALVDGPVDMGADFLASFDFVGFGQDAAGEMYVLDLGGNVSRIDPS